MLTFASIDRLVLIVLETLIEENSFQLTKITILCTEIVPNMKFLNVPT